jgi:hypothetical protein
MSKSLIENILSMLEAENPKDHSGFQHGIEAAIEIIKQAEKDAEFQNTELRLECLKLASNNKNGQSKDAILQLEDDYYDWIMKPLSRSNPLKQAMKKPQRNLYVAFENTEKLVECVEWFKANGITLTGEIQQGSNVLLYSGNRDLVAFTSPFDACDFEKEVTLTEFKANFIN